MLIAEFLLLAAMIGSCSKLVVQQKAVHKPTPTPFLIKTYLIQLHVFRQSILNGPMYIQQIFLCADYGPVVDIVFHRNKNRTLKRDISPDIIRIQFREGVWGGLIK